MKFAPARPKKTGFGSGPGSTPRAGQARQWLKPRRPARNLYRLTPREVRRKLIGPLPITEHGWRLIRRWWLWFAVAVYLFFTEHWIASAIVVFVSGFLYQISPVFYPLAYEIDSATPTDSKEFVASIAGVAGAPVISGNRLTILNDGDEFYPAMLEAIEGAEHSITMEQYILWDGKVGRRFAQAFAERAAQGLPVKILLDAVGSGNVGNEILNLLKKSGCELAWFRPVRWYTINRANFRTHRKSLIADGYIAITGGAGIADHWLGQARNKSEWRDIQVRVEGPAAAVQQTAFAQNWLLTTGELISGPNYFPVDQKAGEVDVQTIQSTPKVGAGSTATMYFLALQCAQSYVYIANPYFVPSLGLIAILSKLAAKGVDIRVMIAGEYCDVWWARQNTVRLLGRLIAAGVAVYEYQKTMLHQKTMVVDGNWGTVGTTNFDNRSFALNEETNVCFHDRHTLKRMREIFLKDLEDCRKVELTQWRRRGIFQWGQEVVASIIEDQV